MTSLLNLFFNHLKTHNQNLAEDEQTEIANNFADIVEKWLTGMRDMVDEEDSAENAISMLRDAIYEGDVTKW